MKRLFLFATVVALTLTVSGLLPAQSNPSIGTWKLNLAKSKYSPGPPPKSQTTKIEAVGMGQRTLRRELPETEAASRIVIRPTTTARITP
jgi:hypothetical protein